MATARQKVAALMAPKKKASRPGEKETITVVQSSLVLYKRRPGPEQVAISVQIDIPGSWFTSGDEGGLTNAERAQKYRATAVEYNERHVFEGARGSRAARIGEAIRFICQSDAEDDATAGSSSSNAFWLRICL